MDRSLKARLIGASVLVLLIVLVVPELLSGRRAATPQSAPTEPGKGPTRTYTIELGSGSTPVAADTVVPRTLTPAQAPLASDRPSDRSSDRPSDRPSRPEAEPPTRRETGTAAPRPAAAPTVTEPPRAAPVKPSTEPAPAVRTPTSAPRTTAVAPATPSRGTWSVQVGAFGSADSARKLVRALEADGFPAYVSPVQREGKTLHRVRVGPESARTGADTLAGRLKARGLPVSLVVND